MSEPSIPTNHLDELTEYFNRNVPVGKPEWWVRAAVVNEEFKFKIGPFKVPPGLIRRIAGGTLERAAAVKWLRPNHPCVSLSDLPKLQERLGLANLGHLEFLKDLMHHSLEIQREHPRLRLWVQKRVALLDYALAPPGEMPRELLVAATALRNGLIQAVNHLNSGQPLEDVDRLAEKLSATALQAAAQAVNSVLGSGPCRVSANLMVPVATQGPITLAFAPDLEFEANSQRAASLWSDLPASDKCLLIVGQTPEAGHLGFWVPLTTTSDGEELPGAPIAYLRMEGAAVFRDDLPDLIGFSPLVKSKWYDYMAHDFKEDLFVSLPFEAPTSPNPLTEPTVPAVLNVNARPGTGGSWHRAYHKEWLDVAKTRVAEFVEVAFYAFLVKMGAQRRAGGPCPVVRTADGWDSLPGFENFIATKPPRIAGGRDEH